MMDPFRPEKEEDIERLNRLLEELHGNFIGHVKARREGKLADNPDLFTGEVWLGQSAVEVGLADGIGHLETEMKKRFGKDVKFRRYGQKRGLLSRFGAEAAESAFHQIEERASFARYGL